MIHGRRVSVRLGKFGPMVQGPLGLYLLSQSFENSGAKAIIKKELSIPNHDAFTSCRIYL